MLLSSMQRCQGGCVGRSNKAILVSMNTPPAKAGGFGLRLKAGLVGHSAD